MVMKRLLANVLAAALVMGVLAGCADGGGAAEELTAVEVAEHIGQAVSLDEMMPRDVERLQRLYDLDPEIVEDFVLYMSSSNVRAEELAVIKVKEANDVERVVESIEQRIAAQTVKFRDYLPEEYNLIERHVMKTRGRFILFAVSEDADRMGEAFEDIVR